MCEVSPYAPCDHAGMESSRRFGHRTVTADVRLGVYVRSFAALRRLMSLTPLGPGLLLFVGPPCSNKSNRFAHASCQTASEAGIGLT